MPLTKEEITKIEEEERVRAEARSKYKNELNTKYKGMEDETIYKEITPVRWFCIISLSLSFISLIFNPFIFIVIMIILFYFLPTIVGFENKKKNAQAIFALNLFLGWTLLGWVVALIWAFTKD